MTLEELQAQRDAILKQMSQPREMHAGDKGLTNRDLKDLEAALARVDAEIAVTKGSAISRVSFIGFRRG